MEPALLAGAVVLFLAFLLWNGLIRAPLRRSVRDKLESPEGADRELEELLGKLRDGANMGPILREIKQRVSDEPDLKLKAAYLCVVGDVLRRTLSRRGTALKWFVKALDADPTCVDARQGMRELLLTQRRGFKLEQLYWSLLSRLDPATHGCDEVLDVWRELADLLERRRSGKKRARALRRLITRLEESSDCEGDGFSDRGCED